MNDEQERLGRAVGIHSVGHRSNRSDATTDEPPAEQKAVDQPSNENSPSVTASTTDEPASDAPVNN